MDNDLNSRLVGHTYEHPGGGRKVTVCESMAGLAAGYVTVRDEDGRIHTENLPFVLSTIENPEHPFRMAASILEHAARLRATATELAALAVSRDLSSEVEAALIEIDDLLGKVANRCARDARKAKTASASSLPAAPKP